MGRVAKNVKEIMENIKKHSKNPNKVKLVAVTKYDYVKREDLEELMQLGVLDFGENRVQVLEAKRELMNDVKDKIRWNFIGNLQKNKVKYIADYVSMIHFGENRVQVLEAKRELMNDVKDKIRWNFIGNLQKNKVKYIADYVSMIHSVNKFSLAEEIDKRAEKVGRVLDVLLEINLSGEESKEGYELEDFYRELPEIMKLKNINIKGLMTMAPNVDDEDKIRASFRKLREIKDELNKNYFQGSLTELSMGMSDDYKIALEEGATIIRIGSGLYKEEV